MNHNHKNTLRKAIDKLPLSIKKMFTKKIVNQIYSNLIPEEKLYLCLNDLTFKEKTLISCENNDPNKVQLLTKIENTLLTNPIFQDMDENHRELIKTDMLFCWYGYGFIIEEYVVYHFYDVNLTHDARIKFVSDKELYAFRFCANEFTKTVYSDKVSTYKFLKKYYKRDLILVSGEKDRESFINFAEGKKEFVKKTVDLAHGDGVTLVRMEDSSEAYYLKYFDSISEKENILFEEIIVQHDQMNVFNKDSLNTVRVYTLNTRNGVVVLASIIRTGRKGSFVDNVSSGGLSAVIDVKTGIVVADAIDKYGKRYSNHPDTGVKFQGFAIPCWNELLNICKEVALLTPDLKFLGWDMAYSKKNSWVIVEVNTAPGIYPAQALPLSGLKKEFSKIISNMNLMIPFSFRYLE